MVVVGSWWVAGVWCVVCGVWCLVCGGMEVKLMMSNEWWVGGGWLMVGGEYVSLLLWGRVLWQVFGPSRCCAPSCRNDNMGLKRAGFHMSEEEAKKYSKLAFGQSPVQPQATKATPPAQTSAKAKPTVEAAGAAAPGTPSLLELEEAATWLDKEGSLKRPRWSSLSAASTTGDEGTTMETASESEAASAYSELEKEEAHILGAGADFLDNVQRQLGEGLGAIGDNTTDDDMNEIAAKMFTPAKVEQLQNCAIKKEVVSSQETKRKRQL